MTQNINSMTQSMPSYFDSAIQKSLADMDTILSDMQKVSGSLGKFLQDLFQHPSKGLGWSQKHAQMVSKFLNG
jgi:hypothetical protein